MPRYVDDKNAQQCGNCRFFDGGGYCLRHAPIHSEHVHEGTVYRSPQWPTVLSVYWCGDWETNAPDRKSV